MSKAVKLDPKAKVENEIKRQVQSLEWADDILYTVFYQAWPRTDIEQFDPQEIALLPSLHFSLQIQHPDNPKGWFFTVGSVPLIGFQQDFVASEVEDSLESLLRLYQEALDNDSAV